MWAVRDHWFYERTAIHVENIEENANFIKLLRKPSSPHYEMWILDGDDDFNGYRRVKKVLHTKNTRRYWATEILCQAGSNAYRFDNKTIINNIVFIEPPLFDNWPAEDETITIYRAKQKTRFSYKNLEEIAKSENT